MCGGADSQRSPQYFPCAKTITAGSFTRPAKGRRDFVLFYEMLFTPIGAVWNLRASAFFNARAWADFNIVRAAELLNYPIATLGTVPTPFSPQPSIDI